MPKQSRSGHLLQQRQLLSQQQAGLLHLAPPAVVSQQLSEVLLAFPAAATEGVQWQVLVRKFEERHKTRLDLQALGHSTPLAAASTLLWDVCRIVDKTDPSNVVVAVEDAVALTPKPGSLGCWPSLYRALCEIAREHGSPDAAPWGGAVSSSVLLSQIRPLLERYWHSSFDESGLGFLSSDGSFVRLKKLKHLLHAVLRWRDEHQAWRRSSCNEARTKVDEALEPCLRLVASEHHNDLLLQCISGGPPGLPSVPGAGAEMAAKGRSQRRPGEHLGEPQDSRLESMQRELERLRSENCTLRVENFVLHHQAVSDDISCAASEPPTPTGSRFVPQFPAELFDDPFEPPPEAMWSLNKASELSPGSMSQTRTLSEFTCASSSVMSMSGTVTPLQPAAAVAPQPPSCGFVPMWFFASAFSGVDVSVIPRGIVETARAHFEGLGAK